MKLSYHPQHNIAYITLKEKRAEVETIRVSDELNVDMAPDGTIYGIELLNANAQLGGNGSAELIVVNEASGSSSTVPLAG
jgi:uncharacterized protein YuzE